FDNGGDFGRQSKLLSHCDAVMQVEGKLTAFFCIRHLYQNTGSRIFGDDDIVIRPAAVGAPAHEQVLFGPDVEADVFQLLGERCPGQKQRDQDWNHSVLRSCKYTTSSHRRFKRAEFIDRPTNRTLASFSWKTNAG